VLGSLQPDTLMEYLQNSQLNTQAHDCVYMAGPSQVPVKVGMLSKRALDVLYVIHIYERCSGYRLTRRACSPIPAMHSPGSEPSDTPLLESAHESSNFVRILLAKLSVDLTPVLLRLGPKVLPQTSRSTRVFLSPQLRCV
jgi:hypothetical protein